MWAVAREGQDRGALIEKDCQDVGVTSGKVWKKKKHRSLGHVKDCGVKNISGGRERWNIWMWEKLLGAAVLWQPNWSSVWLQTQSCHSNEEPICCILRAVCWILMMLQKSQTTMCHWDADTHTHTHTHTAIFTDYRWQGQRHSEHGQ